MELLKDVLDDFFCEDDEAFLTKELDDSFLVEDLAFLIIAVLVSNFSADSFLSGDSFVDSFCSMTTFLLDSSFVSIASLLPKETFLSGVFCPSEELLGSDGLILTL